MKRIRSASVYRAITCCLEYLLLLSAAAACFAAIPPPPMTASQSVALSPDGRIVAMPAEDGIELFDTTTGAVTRRLTGCKCSINQVVFSPDGGALASSGEDCINGKSYNKVHLWDTRTGEMRMMFKGGQAGWIRIGFDGNGDLVGAEEKNPIRVWETATGSLSSVLTEGSLLISPDGHAFHASTAVKSLFKSLERHLNYYTISDDGKVIGTLQSTQPSRIPSDTAVLWDAQTGKRLAAYPKPIQVITMAFAHNSRNVVLGGVDCAMLWNTETGIVKQLLPHVIPASTPHNATTTALVKISKDASIVAFSTLDIVWSTEPQSTRERYDSHLIIFNTQTGKQIASLPK